MICRQCEGPVDVCQFTDMSGQMKFWAYSCDRCRLCAEFPIPPDKLDLKALPWAKP